MPDTSTNERESEKPENSDITRGAVQTREIIRFQQDPLQGGNEGHARLTTESHTELVEKVLVTHEINIAWPIRLSSVNVMQHINSGTENSKTPAQSPSVMRTQETHFKSNDPAEIALRPTLSMSLSLFNPKAFQGTSVNIEARVNLRSGSPECNVSVKNTLGPFSQSELEGMNIEGPQVRLTYSSPKQQETVVNQWHVKTNSTFHSGTPDNDSLGPVKLAESTGGSRPNSTAPFDQQDESAPQGISSVQYPGKQTTQLVHTSTSEQEREKTPVSGRCICTSLSNHAELIGGQATVCSEPPQQLVHEAYSENACLCDIKIDNVPVSNADDNFELKLGNVESEVSHQSEVLAQKRQSEDGNSQTEQHPTITMQTGFSMDAEQEDGIQINDPVAQPDEILVIQEPSSAIIPEIHNEIEAAELDGSIRTQNSESKSPIDHVPNDQAAAVEQQAAMPSNSSLNIQNNEIESPVSKQPGQTEFRAEESYNEYHSTLEPVVGADPQVLASSPDLQQSAEHGIGQGSEEKIFQQGSDTKPAPPTETEQIEGISTLGTSDTSAPEVKDDIDKPDQPADAVLLDSFYLRSSSKKSYAENSSTDLLYHETAKRLTTKLLERMQGQIFSENIAGDKTNEFPTVEPEEQQPTDPSTHHELPDEMSNYVTSPSGVNSARSDSKADLLKPPDAPSYMPSEIIPVKTETSIDSINVQPQTIMRDAEVNTRENELFPVVEDDAQDESEWSHSMYQYRHHYRHLHTGAAGERTRYEEGGSAHCDSQKQGYPTRMKCHFGHRRCKSGSSRRRRSKTVPRHMQNVCMCASKLLADMECMERKGTSVELRGSDDYSEETSSTTQTGSETSEMQKMTMTLLNTLTTTAELLRKQYKRQKAHTMKLASKQARAELRNHQPPLGKTKTEGPVLNSTVTEPTEINIAQNSSCAIQYNPNKRSLNTRNKFENRKFLSKDTSEIVIQDKPYSKTLKSRDIQYGVSSAYCTMDCGREQSPFLRLSEQLDTGKQYKKSHLLSKQKPNKSQKENEKVTYSSVSNDRSEVRHFSTGQYNYMASLPIAANAFLEVAEEEPIQIMETRIKASTEPKEESVTPSHEQQTSTYTAYSPLDLSFFIKSNSEESSIGTNDLNPRDNIQSMEEILLSEESCSCISTDDSFYCNSPSQSCSAKISRCSDGVDGRNSNEAIFLPLVTTSPLRKTCKHKPHATEKADLNGQFYPNRSKRACSCSVIPQISVNDQTECREFLKQTSSSAKLHTISNTRHCFNGDENLEYESKVDLRDGYHMSLDTDNETRNMFNGPGIYEKRCTIGVDATAPRWNTNPIESYKDSYFEEKKYDERCNSGQPILFRI